MDTDARKKIAVEFLQMASAGQLQRARAFIKPGGVHHNMYFAAGWDTLLPAMEEAARESPKQQFVVKHVLADGDLVAVHSHVIPKPGDVGIAVVHLLRFEGTQIAEFWDVAAQIPADSPNKDGAF
ncbi:MAG: nuclear transport factor 2 family protein [Myxococcaceae bacterium]